MRMKRDVVQCVVEEGIPIPEESCVIVTASVVEEKRSKSGYELHIIRVEVLSDPYEIPPIVINHKTVEASMEKLLDYRPITLRN